MAGKIFPVQHVSDWQLSSLVLQGRSLVWAWPGIPWEAPPVQVSLVPPAVLLASAQAELVGLGPAVEVEFAQAWLGREGFVLAAFLQLVRQVAHSHSAHQRV